GLRLDELHLVTRGLFTNRPDGSVYVWSALVSPFDSTGALDPTATYELRADEPLPQSITIKATYASATKQLVVRGAVLANGRPRVGDAVQVQGASSVSATLRDLGETTTQPNGDWTL